MRRSNSFWLLSYRRLADFVVRIFRYIGAAGQIPAVVTYQHFSETLRLGFHFIDHPFTSA